MRHVKNWSAEPHASIARFTDDAFVVELVAGGSFAVPLAWYPRLLDAAPADRERCDVLHHGFIIRWPALGVQFFVPLLATAEVPLEPWDDDDPDAW
jgi:hypothetical protein